MRRKACALMLTAALGGCVSADRGDMNPGCSGSWGRHAGPPNVPGLVGANGAGIPMAAPYNSAPPGSLYAAQQMMSNSVPLDMVQMGRGANVPGMGGVPGGMMPPTMMPNGGVIAPPGVPFAPGVPAGPGVSQTSFMPGMPGMPGGPGGDSGVIHANVPPGGPMSNPGADLMLAQLGGGPPPGANGQVRFAAQRTQIRFNRPTGMKISWFAQGPDGRPGYSNIPLEAPARYNFAQGAIYRLKLSNIEGRPGLEIYPTMEVVPCNPKTEAFLAHSAVPVEFTQEDFKQIAEGNYVTKVIYLPDPNFQDIAGSGTDEIISTRLEPGADPIQEALRRGSILAIIRMGNVDQEAPNTPPLGATGPALPVPARANVQPGMMAPYPGYLGGLQQGGPGTGAPGAGSPGNGPVPPPGYGPPPGYAPVPPPPPGYGPMPPPPGFSPAPSTTTPPNSVGGSSVLFPPGPGIFAPTAPSTAEKKNDASFVPPPVAPTPTPTVTEKKTPTPSVGRPGVAPAVAPAVAEPMITAPAASKGFDVPPALPTAPMTPPATELKTMPDVPAPSLPPPPITPNFAPKVETSVPPLPPAPPVTPVPTVPGLDGAKKIEAPAPPAPPSPPPPSFPTSKNATPPAANNSIVLPASGPGPMIPDLDGPPVVPAFPATPGAVRPSSPMLPASSTMPPSLPELPRQ